MKDKDSDIEKKCFVKEFLYKEFTFCDSTADFLFQILKKKRLKSGVDVCLAFDKEADQLYALSFSIDSLNQSKPDRIYEFEHADIYPNKKAIDVLKEKKDKIKLDLKPFAEALPLIVQANNQTKATTILYIAIFILGDQHKDNAGVRRTIYTKDNSRTIKTNFVILDSSLLWRPDRQKILSSVEEALYFSSVFSPEYINGYGDNFSKLDIIQTAANKILPNLLQNYDLAIDFF